MFFTNMLNTSDQATVKTDKTPQKPANNRRIQVLKKKSVYQANQENMQTWKGYQKFYSVYDK